MTKGPEYLTVQDFLVSVPQKQDGKWEYTAKAELKYDYTTPTPSPSRASPGTRPCNGAIIATKGSVPLEQE